MCSQTKNTYILGFIQTYIQNVRSSIHIQGNTHTLTLTHTHTHSHTHTQHTCFSAMSMMGTITGTRIDESTRNALARMSWLVSCVVMVCSVQRGCVACVYYNVMSGHRQMEREVCKIENATHPKPERDVRSCTRRHRDIQ